MTRVSLLRFLVFLVLFVGAPAVFADEVYTQDAPTPCFWYDDNACFDYSSQDEAATTTVTCTDPYGCPNCGMNDEMTNSVCYRLWGAAGRCTCEPNGTYRDKHGILHPRCKLSGSCSQRA